MDAVFEIVGAHLGDASELLLVGMLVMMRILPVIFVAPFLGGRLVPPETKMGIAFTLAIVLYPIATARMDGPFDINGPAYLVLMLKELFLGFTIAFVAAEIFYCMDIAGRALDVIRGSSLAEIQVPELGYRASPIGNLLFQLFLVIYVSAGGHRWFLDSFAESFVLVPIDQLPNLRAGFFPLVDDIMHYTGTLFSIGFALMFPGIFASLMTDMVFGMLNRVAPQLNAYFMSMSAKAMTAVLLLFYAMGMTVHQMTTLVADSIHFLRGVIHQFG